jgi:hypothetical protein
MLKQNDSAGAFMLSIQTAVMTSQVLLKLIQEHLRMKEKSELSSGKTTLAKLAAEAGGNLDNIKISNNNIGDFNDTAQKYNLSYALKKNSDTDPPTWYVFIKQDKSSKDAMDRALREYYMPSEKTPVITREGINDIDIEIPREHNQSLHELGIKKVDPESEHASPDFSEMPDPEPPDK